MHELDACAYANAWRDIHPAEKCLFAAVCMGAALLSATPWVPLMVGCLAAAAILLAARVPRCLYVRTLLVPTSFLLWSCMVLAVSARGGLAAPEILAPLPFGLVVTHEGLDQAIGAFVRSFGAFNMLLLVALTTPMTDIVSILRSIRVPSLLLDMMTFAYRQVFVLDDIVRQVRRAQVARLGYDTLRASRSSLGTLAGFVLVSALRRNHNSHLGLLARGYEGDVRLLSREFAWSARNLWLGGGIGGILLALAVTIR